MGKSQLMLTLLIVVLVSVSLLPSSVSANSTPATQIVDYFDPGSGFLNHPMIFFDSYYWAAQTYTTSSHQNITTVSVILFGGSSSAGTVTLGLRATSNGLPTGPDLSSGTIAGSSIATYNPGAWYNFTMSPALNIGSGVMLAIVLRAPSTTFSNCLYWGGIDTSGTGVWFGNSSIGWTNNPGCTMGYKIYAGVPPPAPTADFSATPTTGTISLTVSFTDKSTGIANSWLWNFGDDSTNTTQNPIHTYGVSAGNYTVSLTTTGPGGSNTETKPNYINALTPPGGLIAQSGLTGDWIALYASLYHCTDENIAQYDYYAVEVDVQNLYKFTPSHYQPYLIWPFKARICVEMSDFVQEEPPKNYPQSGVYGSSGALSFGWFGVGFAVDLPAHQVSYSSGMKDGKFIAQWDVTPTPLSIPGAYGQGITIFEDYAEFWIGVRVPEGYKPSFAVSAEVCWAKMLSIITYYQCHDENVGWVTVDPPIAPTPPQPLGGIKAFTGFNSSVKTMDLYGNPKTTFKRGEHVCLFINWTLLVNVTYTTTMFVEFNDSNGQTTGMCGMEMTSPQPFPQGNYSLVADLTIAPWAHTGVATIAVRFAPLPYYSNNETIASLIGYKEYIPATTCTITIT